MNATRALVVAVLALALPTMARAAFQDLTLQLSHLAERPGTLYVGEPLELEATVLNSGTAALTGYFVPMKYGPNTAFYMRSPRGSQIRMDEPYDPPGLRAEVCGYHPMQRLDPQQSRKSRERFVFDPRTRALRTADAGTYEFVVAQRPIPDDGSLEVRSEVLRIVVSEVPERFREAYAAYESEGLAVLVSSPAQRLRENADLTRTAEDFLRRHADSPYGRHVAKALLDGLRARAFSGSPTRAELEAYERWETNPNLRRAVGAPPVRP